jgi:hypothetical protein
MIQHEVSVHLNRPIDQVFAYLIDTRNLLTWQSDLIEIEQLTEGPARAGTRIREVRRIGRGPSEILTDITVFEPNKRFETRTATRPQVSVSYSFEAEDGGTRLNFKFVMLTSGIMRLLEPVIARSIRKQFASDFEKLQHVLGS